MMIPTRGASTSISAKASSTSGTVAVAGAAGSARKPKTHTVTIDGAKFSPETLTTAAGDTVVWVNNDIVAHTATATSNAFDSKTIQPGKSWKFVAKQKGEFPYICSFHPMKGVLRVK